MRRAIEGEILSDRISIRSDRDVLADVTLRSQLISLLLSYSTPWLRLGLETIFGEVVTMENLLKSLKEKSAVRQSLGIDTNFRPKVSFQLPHFLNVC